MATKIYNRVTYTFIINGEAVSFYCSTTDTRNGFCHHVYTWGKGKDGEHTRISYFNRTWERSIMNRPFIAPPTNLEKRTARRSGLK